MSEEDRIPTFEEWVTHCFSDPVPDVPWDDLPAPVVADYLLRLLEHPEQWANELSDARVDKGLWFIFFFDGFHRDALDESVPIELRIRWVLALKTLYRDLFLPRCTAHLQHLGEDGSPLNLIAYMLWDIAELRVVARAGDHPLVDPIFDVLSYALTLDSLVCRESALHGLGHLWPDHRPRVEQVIDAFLRKHPGLDERLVFYGQRARAGRVQ